jgi:hypothetical protein
MAAIDIYLNRILARSKRDPATGCLLLWQGAIKDGYGWMMGPERKPDRVHRIIWRARKGPIPVGLCVCHTCDVRNCGEETHLFLGTNKDNVDDKMRKGRLDRRDGEHNGRAKLTATQVLRIRRDHRLHREIATQYGVTRTMISNIKRGDSWATV